MSKVDNNNKRQLNELMRLGNDSSIKSESEYNPDKTRVKTLDLS